MSRYPVEAESPMCDPDANAYRSDLPMTTLRTSREEASSR
jgi:hypothetical protein